jgi:hypothetical protein
LWWVNLLVALPAALLMSGALRRSIGSSLVHQKLRDGFDTPWFGEFAAAARGVEQAFTPGRLLPSAFLENLEGWLTGGLFGELPLLIILGLSYAAIWALMLGGALRRLAGERLGIAAFLREGGRFFWRLIRLTMFSGLLYAAVYGLQRGLFKGLEEITRDVTAETTVLGYSVAVYLLTALLLTLIHMLFGYAKIVTVVEDRRSVVLAVFRALRFVARHPVAALGQYYGVLVISTALFGAYFWLAPGTGQSTSTAVVVVFLLGQAYLVVKLVMRLSLLGGQLELFIAANRPT